MGKGRGELGMESLEDHQSTGLTVPATAQETGSGRMGTGSSSSNKLCWAVVGASCAQCKYGPAAGPPLSSEQAKPVSAAAPLQPEAQLWCPWQVSSPKTGPVRNCELGNIIKEAGCYGACAPYFDGKARTDH